MRGFGRPIIAGGIIPGMSAAARDVWTPEAVRQLDRTAIDAFGIPGSELMQRAAAEVCRVALLRWPAARRWLVLCGGGNNGGDGYLVAHLARQLGVDASVCAIVDPATLTGDAATAWRTYVANGGVVEAFAPGLVADADLIIDALLGTGLGRPVAGAFLTAIEAVNAARTPVLAVDIPSGLDGTTGLPKPVAIRADCTVTFVGHKLGLFVGDGLDCAGEICFSGLGIPEAVVERAGLAGSAALRLFQPEDLEPLLPRRRATDHKGRFGHVLVVGGNAGFSGAARLAGEAALRSGAGLVTVATRAAHAALLPLVRPELMARGVESAAELAPLLARATLVAVGPGLGQDGWARALLDAILATSLPLVVDADALNLIAGSGIRRGNWILTPHPGEAGRLLDCSAADIQRDRPGALSRLVARHGGTVLLKGKGTLVGAGGTTPWVITTGNPGMASGGMGDVLTGIVAGILAGVGAASPGARPLPAGETVSARMTDPVTADLVAAAAHAHGAAGDAAAAGGQRGLLALDLLDHLRPCLNP